MERKESFCGPSLLGRLDILTYFTGQEDEPRVGRHPHHPHSSLLSAPSSLSLAQAFSLPPMNPEGPATSSKEVTSQGWPPEGAWDRHSRQDRLTQPPPGAGTLPKALGGEATALPVRGTWLEKSKNP